MVPSPFKNLHPMFKAFLFRGGSSISKRSPTPGFHPLHRHHHYPFPFSLEFCTTTADSRPFVVSYLINNCGFSPKSALKASKEVHFTTSQKPDLVFAFFRSHGFSDSNTRDIIRREPWLLSCDTHKRVLPKFQFLASKGASSSDIVNVVTKNPRFLKNSLANRIIPSYTLVSRFVESEEKAFDSIMHCLSLLNGYFVIPSVNFLVDNGVASFNIAKILRSRPRVMCSSGLKETVQELKQMGFDPSKTHFSDALLAKKCLSESQWSEKIDTFKRWGWSEEMVLEAFRRQPCCMLSSIDKIDRVMRFWVDQLGWSSSHLVKGPGVFKYSFEKRVVPRASVVHCLISKGLRSESASLLSPYFMSEKMFLQRFVNCFEKEEADKLLKLYQEKMNFKR